MKTGKIIYKDIGATIIDGEREWYFVLKQHVEARITEKLIGTDKYIYTLDLLLDIRRHLRKIDYQYFT